MYKHFKIIVSILIVMSLLSCSKSSETSINPELAGTYRLVRIDGGSIDEGVSAEEVSRMNEYGLVCELTLNSDGTAVLNNYGEEETYIWSGSELISDDSEESVGFTEEEAQLVIRDEETSQALIFERASSAQPEGK